VRKVEWLKINEEKNKNKTIYKNRKIKEEYKQKTWRRKKNTLQDKENTK
jgi:hypothetical protein